MRVQKHHWNTVKKAARQTIIILFKQAAAEKKQKVIAFLSRDTWWVKKTQLGGHTKCSNVF